ncbi:MAG TPA: hypothetical protein VGK73_33215, partial [Polyangiaceae bacterium]
MAMGAPEVKLGTNPGYVFQFFYETNDVLEPKHFLQISGDDYAAEIDAVLPGGFGSGRYEFAFEGMTDADHKLLAAAEGGKLVVARLHLYWRDADWSGWAASYFGGIIGIDQWVGGLSEGELAKQLVAELAVVNVTRRLGARRYETVIKARERAFDHLARAKVPAGKDGTPPKSLREAVTRLIDVSKLPPATWHEAPGTNLQEEKPTPWTVGESGTAALKRLGEELEARTGKHGRGMVLIRDGVIEFGVRDIEKQKVEVLKPLTLATGLLQTDSL